MKPFRLNNLHILGFYLFCIFVYTLYYMPFFPENLFNDVFGIIYLYGLAFIADFFY